MIEEKVGVDLLKIKIFKKLVKKIKKIFRFRKINSTWEISNCKKSKSI